MTSRFLQFYRRHRRWFDSSDKILNQVHQARGGGWLSKSLVGVTITRTLIDTMYPVQGPWIVFRGMGYFTNNDPIGGFICDLLDDSPLEREIIGQTTFCTGYFWPEADTGAVYSNDGSFSDGTYLGPDSYDKLSNTVQKLVWTDHKEMMIVTKPADPQRGQNQGSGKFSLIPMHPLGRYIGRRQPQWYADRLQRYDPTEARTLCFRGPTGVGKSVLARHVARQLQGKDARVLKVSSEVLTSCRPDELLSFVSLLQPTVLLLDDLALNNRENTEKFLATLEILRTPGCLVVVTMMTSPGVCAKSPKPGSWHFPGMRPGRIDEIFTLPLPDKEERIQILSLYRETLGIDISDRQLRKIAKRTKGLTGAYLMNVMQRISVHGWNSWKEEIDHVLYAAPVPTSETDSTPRAPSVTPSPGRPTNSPKTHRELDWLPLNELLGQ